MTVEGLKQSSKRNDYGLSSRSITNPTFHDGLHKPIDQEVPFEGRRPTNSQQYQTVAKKQYIAPTKDASKVTSFRGSGSFLFHNSSTQQTSEPAIFVTHGCLLLPVLFLLWYYWTKRFARKVVRGLLTAAPPFSKSDGKVADDFDPHDNSSFPYRQRHSFDLSPPLGCDEEEFSSWDDVMEHNLQDSSLRYVRWYKAKNNSPSQSWANFSASALLSRFRGQPSHRTSSDSSPTIWLSSLLSTEDEENSGTREPSNRSQSDDANFEWQCLSDVTRIDLCYESPPSNDENDGAFSKSRKRRDDHNESSGR